MHTVPPDRSSPGGPPSQENTAPGSPEPASGAATEPLWMTASSGPQSRTPRHLAFGTGIPLLPTAQWVLECSEEWAIQAREGKSQASDKHQQPGLRPSLWRIQEARRAVSCQENTAAPRSCGHNHQAAASPPGSPSVIICSTNTHHFVLTFWQFPANRALSAAARWAPAPSCRAAKWPVTQANEICGVVFMGLGGPATPLTAAADARHRFLDRPWGLQQAGRAAPVAFSILGQDFRGRRRGSAACASARHLRRVWALPSQLGTPGTC